MPLCDHPSIPSIEEIRDASGKFSKFTALGSDDLHPRHIRTLCDASLEALRSFFAAMLRLYHLPQAIALLLVVLLPKPDGGTRPIGLFPAVVRIWSQWARCEYAVKWERLYERGYWFGERGKSCDMCTWTKSLTAEYASSTGQAAVGPAQGLRARHARAFATASGQAWLQLENLEIPVVLVLYEPGNFGWACCDQIGPSPAHDRGRMRLCNDLAETCLGGRGGPDGGAVAVSVVRSGRRRHPASRCRIQHCGRYTTGQRCDGDVHRPPHFRMQLGCVNEEVSGSDQHHFRSDICTRRDDIEVGASATCTESWSRLFVWEAHIFRG